MRHAAIPDPTCMVWRGRELRSPNDWVQAMYRIETRAEADEFMAAARAVDPYAERTVGYLTGYMDREAGQRARGVFGVDHPVMGELVDDGQLTFDELLTLGASMERHTRAGMDFDEAAAEARADVYALRTLREAHRG